MTNESRGAPAVQITLGDALNEYLTSLKPEQRHDYEGFVRKYVEYAGAQMAVGDLTGSRVESYAEVSIKHTDPNADKRVAALKAWFQFLKKKNYANQNFGVHIRIRKPASSRAGNRGMAVRIEEPPIEMTAEGIEDLKRELAEIESKVPDMVRAIEQARSDGDLRENAPYHAAREALAFSDNRKKRIETALKRAVVVDRSQKEADVTAVGSVVTVTYLDKGLQISYQLVGAREANASDRKISVESPVGTVLLGKRIGEEVEVTAPQGVMRYRIDAITHRT
jgi:transcription elongation factor GreA